MNEMKVIIVVNTEIMLNDVKHVKTQKEMAKTYACLLRWPENQAVTDIKKVNEAIIKRWGVKGFVRIKDMAWKPEKLFASV